MELNIIVNNKHSWIIPYIKTYIRKSEHSIKLFYDYNEVPFGKISFFLSCEKIIPAKILMRSIHNLIVHESDLPKGRGWSPLTWQVLEGKNDIITTLFEASENFDEGLFYYKDVIRLNGTELINEIRDKQFNATINLIEKFIINYPNNLSHEQIGVPSYYNRRTPIDSEIPFDSRISDIFNNFRVADNIRYPIYFIHNGSKYIIHVFKSEDES